MEPEAAGNDHRVAIIANTSSPDGAIEVQLTGEPGPGAVEGARGFVGIALRIAPDVWRATLAKGRADDQVRRNHGCQAISCTRLIGTSMHT